MRKFQFLFSAKNEGGNSSVAAAALGVPMAGKPLRYDPHLILQLKQEHASLRKLFDEIREAARAEDFATVQSVMRELNICLNMHLLEENVKFYAYLRSALSSNSADLATMTAYWKEMQDIGRAVIQFFKKYEAHAFTPESRAAFGSELEAVGAALTSRLAREEEQLFTLYLP